MFDEFDKYLKISDGYEEPESKEYAPTENLQVCWLESVTHIYLVPVQMHCCHSCLFLGVSCCAKDGRHFGYEALNCLHQALSASTR